MLSDWCLRLRSLVGGRRVDRELDDELAFHLEQQVARLVASGIDRAEAVRLARLDLGGLEQIKEEHRDARGISFVTDLARDVRYAVRTLLRLPGFAAAAVLVLAFAIGAGTVVFTVIYGVLISPLPYEDPRQLLTLRAHSDATGATWGYSYPDFLDIERDSRSFTAAAWAFRGGMISAPGDPEYVEARQASAGLLSVLGAPLQRGRFFLPEEDRRGGTPVAVISDRIWRQRYGGRPDAIGERLVFEGLPHTIVGIARPEFELRGVPEVFIPLGQNTDQRMQNREARFIHVLARLGDPFILADARAELSGIGERLTGLFPASNAGRRFTADPLLQEIAGDVGDTLWLLFAASGVLLLIACTNIASLLLARGVARCGEMATRAALGASRIRLMRQCLAESATLGLAGGVLGVLLAAAGIGPFLAIWPDQLPRSNEVRLGWQVLAAALGGSLACGLVFGIVPALRVRGGTIEDALRAGGRGVTRATQRAHGMLVVVELALAIVLLVAAATLVRTLVALSSLEPGFEAGRVVVARVALSPSVLADPGAIRTAWADILERARRLPDVEAVALTDIVPMRPGENTLPYSTTAATKPSNESPVALASSVTPGYLETLGIPLLAGRFIDERDRGAGAPVVVIDSHLAMRAFGRTDVIDRVLWVPAISPSPIRIIGVVGHVRHWGLARDDSSPVRDQMYYPLDQVPPRLLRLFSTFMSMTIRTPKADVVAARLQANVDRPFGDHALHEVRTMDQLVSRSLARQRFLVTLFTVLGGTALLLACTGVYGVLAYLTSQRAAEFGVRLALGAKAGDLMRMVLRESARLVAAGVAAGAVAAWGSGFAIEHYVAGAKGTQPLTLVAMVGLLACAALLASVLPARRASRIDPVQVLRKA